VRTSVSFFLAIFADKYLIPIQERAAIGKKGNWIGMATPRLAPCPLVKVSAACSYSPSPPPTATAFDCRKTYPWASYGC
jgi:hypothetical protein